MRIPLKIIVLIAALLILAAGIGCKNKDTRDMMNITASGAGDTAVPVKVVPAAKGEISSYIETTTTLEAEKNVDIVSQTTGLVTGLLVEEGDSVRKGQVLLKIDDREAKATYNSSLATFEERKRQWDRAQETFEKRIVSKELYEQARYNYAKADSDLQSARLRLEYTTVRAPFGGIITERAVHSGSMLSINQRLFKIVDIDPLLAKIHLPERELSKVRNGQPATLNLEAYPEKEFKAFIKMINPVVDPASGTFKVTLEMSGGSDLLRPGLFASVFLVTQTRNDTLLIPKQALLLESEHDTVFIVDGKFAYTREVSIGFRDDKHIEILEGIEESQYIVVVGQDGINSGTEVKMFDMDGKEIEVKEEPKEEEEDEFEDEFE